MAKNVLTGNGSVEESMDTMFNGGFSISAFGTWGGGTLSFTATADGVNYTPIQVVLFSDGTTVTSAGANILAYGNAVGLKSIKATLAGATNPNLTVAVTGKPA